MSTATRQLDSGSGFLETVETTSYPFAAGTGLSIGSVEIPAGLLLSVQVYCVPGTTLPAKIQSVQATDFIASSKKATTAVTRQCVVNFADASGETIGSVALTLGGSSATTVGYPGTAGILSMPILNDGILRGKVAYKQELAGLLYGAALNSGGTAVADNESLVLDPRCHYPWLVGKVQRLVINGTSTTNDVRILPGTGVLTTQDEATGTLIFGVIGTYVNGATTDVSGIKYLALPKKDDGNDYAIKAKPIGTAVNPDDSSQYDLYWVGGMHIVLKNYVTSNVRVITSAAGVTLRGSADG